MTTQPTPGPWSTFSQVERFQHRDEGDEETYEHWYIMKGATTIASMNSPCLLYKNAEADARLIAAAPRMLELVRTIAMLGDVENADERAMLAERYAADAIKLVRDLHGDPT